ncbi:MAG TPA: TIGR01777 family oxidoreductase [Acidimicrobiia bacterium]|nr:TIGR01777 family oxidoreductase [Acidimicrobiia bacterium]
MEVLVTGASGFVGTALTATLRAAGHRPITAVRGQTVASGVDGIAWDPAQGSIDTPALEGIGGVVNLAGAGIGDRRWTAARKQLVVDSRTRSTELLSSALAKLKNPPGVFVSGSAVGYYGDRGDATLTEQDRSGDDFTARLCVSWEAATRPAAEAGIAVSTIRTGIVLDARGGMLGRIVVPFRLGLGGRLGSGRQYLSWISMTDEVRAILFLLEHPEIAGPVNLTAPSPVTNAEFTTELGQQLHRPTRVPTPLAPLRLVYGSELVRTLLLASQRALPRVLMDAGFQFEHPTVDAALEAALAS